MDKPDSALGYYLSLLGLGWGGSLFGARQMLRDRDKRLDEHERDISLLRDILSDQISKGELLRMHMENAGKFDTIFRLLEKGADKHTQDYEHLFTLMNTLPKRKGDAE